MGGENSVAGDPRLHKSSFCLWNHNQSQHATEFEAFDFKILPTDPETDRQQQQHLSTYIDLKVFNVHLPYGDDPAPEKLFNQKILLSTVSRTAS